MNYRGDIMHIDVLVCEIGSTTTIVNAFDLKSIKFIGQGFYKTTVEDVNIGVERAIDNLCKNLNCDEITYGEVFATSSAAGGLKMSVHGLVYDMTVKAAYESCVGAGANIQQVTSGLITDYELEELINSKPNIIMVAGGVDYGEKATALANAKAIAKLQLSIPVIYAGNIQNHQEVKAYFKKYQQTDYLYIVDNVYPSIDELNVEEARKVIHAAFEEHITKANGMENIHKTLTSKILPTPGAVMKALELFALEHQNVLCLDIGGATTDVHSVSEIEDDDRKLRYEVEVKAKRSVEGDLGVFVNRHNVFEKLDKNKLLRLLDEDLVGLETRLNNLVPIPSDQADLILTKNLGMACLVQAIQRHVGKFVRVYTTSGLKTIIKGTDLTKVQTIIATGGILTKHPERKEIVEAIFSKELAEYLIPNESAKIYFDNHYLMASIGVLSMRYPKEALQLLKESLNYVS